MVKNNIESIFGIKAFKKQKILRQLLNHILIKYEITYLEWIILQTANTNLTYKEISTLILIKKNTLCEYVNKLKEKKLAYSEMIYEDGYGMAIYLTPKGKNTLDGILNELELTTNEIEESDVDNQNPTQHVN